MEVTQCDMPQGCAFSRDRDTYYYWDCFETSLSQPDLSAQEIYLGIFSHFPQWGKWLLLLRNKIVSVFGIRGPTTHPSKKPSWANMTRFMPNSARC